MKARSALVAASTIVVIATMLTSASANAASPVLEFVTPGNSLPVSFTVQGGPLVAELAGFDMVVYCTGSTGTGEITGQRSTVSSYEFTGCVARGAKPEATCESEGAGPGNLTAGPIAAELVYLDQAKGEVGILLNPGGGIYMSFECGGERTEARGSFLAAVTPVNTEASSFTATLAESGAMQIPDECEGVAGEKLIAIPEGKRETAEWVTTGVASTFTVSTSAPVQIRAITAAEVEARQRAEEARQREQRRQEEEAAATAKRHQEEAAAKKLQEEEAAATEKRAEEATAQLRAAIAGALKANGKSSRIGALLRHGGLTLDFNSSEPGRLVIQWWELPPGAHLARSGRLGPVLVAQGDAVFAGAGVGKVKVGLTRQGRGLLEHAIKLKLTARVGFTPAEPPAISATGALTFRR